MISLSIEDSLVVVLLKFKLLRVTALFAVVSFDALLVVVIITIGVRILIVWFGVLLTESIADVGLEWQEIFRVLVAVVHVKAVLPEAKVDQIRVLLKVLESIGKQMDDII